MFVIVYIFEKCFKMYEKANQTQFHFEIRQFSPTHPPHFSVKHIRPHVIFFFENRSFHQDRPTEISSKNIRGHVIFSFENRALHQDRPPESFFNMSLSFLNDFSTYRCAQREHFFKISFNSLNNFFNI